MPHIAQHQAAELWEVCRDHYVGAATLRLMAQGVTDPQLRATMERHAQEFEQAAQRLEQHLHEPGAGTGRGAASPGATYGGYGHGHAWNEHAGAQGPYGTHQVGNSAYDVFVAAACLDKCKSMAVKCTLAATESAQPARSHLYQLAGEHLRMAEEHYHWLERHGAYAGPSADPSAINEYTHKLRQYAAAGRQLTQQAASYVAQAVAQGAPVYSAVAPQHTQFGWNVSPTGTQYTTGTHGVTYSVSAEPGGYAAAPYGGHTGSPYGAYGHTGQHYAEASYATGAAQSSHRINDERR